MDYLKISIRSLEWARRRDYRGHSKFDALNSPLLQALSVKSRFLRAAFIFGISRMPINIRPLLFVQKRQNPKGLALFAMTYFNLYKVTGDSSLRDEGLRLLEILLSLSKRNKYSGHCWGYDHPWQSTAFFCPPYEPNCVTTCFVGQAFLEGYKLVEKREYLEVCKSVVNFIFKDLTQIDVGQGKKCYSYTPNNSWKVININALVMNFLANLHSITKEEEYKTVSQAIMKWVISEKTDYHAWYYSDPPEASRITHDNYHTGFVLDSIQRYMEVFPVPEIRDVWDKGLAFYKSQLFTMNHAPKWMYDRTYPCDIHGAAQGIITFSLASRFDLSHLNFAKDILDWTLRYLYDPRKSRFYYQKGKYWTKKFTLMRWSQAWMVYALSVFIIHSRDRT